MKEQSIEEVIYSETEKRLKVMESPDYDFPRKITGLDWGAIIISIVVCTVLIALCMLGVIN